MTQFPLRSHNLYGKHFPAPTKNFCWRRPCDSTPAAQSTRDGEPGGIRTHDPKIKSLVLYQLSYRLPVGLNDKASLRSSSRR
jgi:hypothetical protein